MRPAATTPPALDAAAAWMAGRSRREQVLLAVLGGFLLVAVLWLAILRPLLDARVTAIGRIAAYEQLMVDVRAAGPAGAPVPPLSGPLETALPAQASAFGVAPTVTAGGQVAVVGARYDSVIRWLAALEASGATLSSVRIERGASDGLVDVTLRVLQP
jgi:general secretion pathway protein M